MCLCNRSNSAKKKRRAPLTQKETAHAYRSVVRVSTASKSVVLKLQCLKTHDYATDVVCHLGTSCLFSTCFCLPFTLRGGRRVKIAVTQMMKSYYRKQCILRHHDINDRTYETIDFLFRPSDIYRHIAQPYYHAVMLNIATWAHEYFRKHVT